MKISQEVKKERAGVSKIDIGIHGAFSVLNGYEKYGSSSIK